MSNVNIELTIMGFLIIFTLVLGGGLGIEKYCDSHPSYFQDDMCYNTDYRCEIECGNYGYKYQYHIEHPCWCDCGDIKVSICTGMKQ